MRQLKVKKLSMILAAGFLTMLVLGTAGVANANLIMNGGFEDGTLTPWTQSGSAILSNQSPFVHSGTYGAILGSSSDTNGGLSQGFTLLDGTKYCFSVWYRLQTEQYVSNWDQFGVNLTIYYDSTQLNDPTAFQQVIPGNLSSASWTAFNNGQFYATEWMLLEGYVDTSAISEYSGLFNLSLQATGNQTAYTRVAFDDASVEACAPVPEPSTILLLGSGLVGLAWYGRKRKKA